MSKRNSLRGYGRYQGRRASRTRAVLMGIIIFLALLLIAGVAVLIFFQDNLVYGDNGVDLELPWENEVSSAPVPEHSSPIIITDETGNPIAPSDAPTTKYLNAVHVSRTALLSGTATDQVVTAGGNAVIITMKNDDGTLNYVSAVPMAVDAATSGAEPEFNTAVDALIDGDLYTVAQISCFRDHALPGYNRELALQTNSGYRWADFEEIRWTSPANQTVCDYLTALCVEMAEMGFDEILLTNCGYPPSGSGHMSWIRKGDAYPKGNLDRVITPFLEQVKAALEPYNVKLSVYTDPKYLSGTTDEATDTGLTPALLLNSFDRIWLPGEQVALGLTYSSVSDRESAEKILVSCGTEAGEKNSDWAIF